MTALGGLIGVLRSTTDGDGAFHEATPRHADAALYRAEEMGRRRVEVESAMLIA